MQTLTSEENTSFNFQVYLKLIRITPAKPTNQRAYYITSQWKHIKLLLIQGKDWLGLRKKCWR